MTTLALSLQIMKICYVTKVHEIYQLYTNESTKKIEEIKTDFQPERFEARKITGIFKALKLTDSLREFNFIKRKRRLVVLV